MSKCISNRRKGLRVTLISLIGLLIVSCRTVKEYQYIEVRDTVISVIPDTASTFIEMGCQNDTIVIKEVVTEQGKRSHLTPSITTNGSTAQIQVESVSEGKEIALEGITEKERIVETVEVDKPIPSYYKFCSWYFWITVLLIVLYIGWKVVKWYMRI